jgi:hypothetical protein
MLPLWNNTGSHGLKPCEDLFISWSEYEISHPFQETFQVDY